MTHLLKKISIFLLVAVLALGMLTACGTSQGQGASGGGNAPVKMEKLRVWSDNAHEQSLRDEQVAKFNETIGKEQGIELEYTVYGTGWADTIKVATQAGDAAELFRPNGVEPRDAVSAGYYVPIIDFPGGAELIAKYEGSLITNDHVFDGKVYTLPYNLTTYKYVVNLDLFEKAGIKDMPKTWAEVRDAAKKITDVGGGVEYGFGLSLQSTWTLTSGMTRQNFSNTGHIGFDNAGDLIYKWSDFLPVVNAIQGMINDGSVLPGYEGMDADQVRAQFAEGKIGILNAASFDVAVYNNQFPAKCNWDVIDAPSFDDSGNKTYKEVVGGTNLLAFGVAAKKMPEKAMTVYQWFYSDENLAEMYEHGLYIPFRQEALALAKKEPEAKGFAKFASVPNSTLVLPLPSRIIPLEGDTFEVALVNILATKGDAAAGLADVDKRYNDALAKISQDDLNAFKSPNGWSAK